MSTKRRSLSDAVKSLSPLQADEVPNRFAPFLDLDKNGVIIVTIFDWIEKNENRMHLVNISRQFTAEGLRKFDSERMVKIDFEQRLDRLLPAPDLKMILDAIDRLYTNEIDQLAFENLPHMNYSVLAGTDVSNLSAAQWQRSDLDKLKAHIRMLYDATLTRQ